jgi:subtilase family serine protease
MSTIYGKPSWQTGTGVATDGRRDVPDVSLTSAGHDGYLIYQEGGLYVVGGTSAASPSFAGVMALVVQGTGARQGNANTAFYPLASKQRAGGAAVFHDITSGNNSVPGQTGFSATAGFDQATGLGSIDASILVSHWSDATIVPAYQAALSASSLSVVAGASNSVNLNVTVSGGFSAAVALSITGLPTGVSAVFTPATLSVPGSGSGVLSITAASTARPGVYSATVAASSGSTKHTLPLSVTIAPAPTFTLTPSVSSVTVSSGVKGTMKITCAALGGFNSAVALSISGLPAGITAAFSAQTLSAPGNGSATITLTKTSGKTGSTHFTVTAKGGSLTQSVTIGLTVK